MERCPPSICAALHSVADLTPDADVRCGGRPPSSAERHQAQRLDSVGQPGRPLWSNVAVSTDANDHSPSDLVDCEFVVVVDAEHCTTSRPIAPGRESGIVTICLIHPHPDSGTPLRTPTGTRTNSAPPGARLVDMTETFGGDVRAVAVAAGARCGTLSPRPGGRVDARIPGGRGSRA